MAVVLRSADSFHKGMLLEAIQRGAERTSRLSGLPADVQMWCAAPAPGQPYGRYRPNISRVPRRTTAGCRTDNVARGGFVHVIAVDRSPIAATPQATSAMVMMTERMVRAARWLRICTVTIWSDMATKYFAQPERRRQQFRKTGRRNHAARLWASEGLPTGRSCGLGQQIRQADARGAKASPECPSFVQYPLCQHRQRVFVGLDDRLHLHNGLDAQGAHCRPPRLYCGLPAPSRLRPCCDIMLLSSKRLFHRSTGASFIRRSMPAIASASAPDRAAQMNRWR